MCWDGAAYWATLNGRPGDEGLLEEARRLAYNIERFSLPFNLKEPKGELRYEGMEGGEHKVKLEVRGAIIPRSTTIILIRRTTGSPRSIFPIMGTPSVSKRFA